MNETDAKCIVCSAWEAQNYLGKDYTVNLKMTTKDDPGCFDIQIMVEKDFKTVFAHYWQTGDTVESFLNGFNARFNSIFECEA